MRYIRSLKTKLTIAFILSLAFYVSFCDSGINFTDIEEVKGGKLPEDNGNNTPGGMKMCNIDDYVFVEAYGNDFGFGLNDLDMTDTDGDGFPDALDHWPGFVYYLCIRTQGVSAAWVYLNDEEIFSPSSFHNEPCVFGCKVINPTAANCSNSVRARIAGSPGDRLAFGVFQWDAKERRMMDKDIFTAELVRQTGAPQEGQWDFCLR